MKIVLKLIAFFVVSTASIAYAGSVVIYEPNKGSRWLTVKTNTIK